MVSFWGLKGESIWRSNERVKMSTLGEKEEEDVRRKTRRDFSFIKEKKKSHALKENTHSHPTVAEAELAAVAVVVVVEGGGGVEKATCVGLETLVTSCCCWLELEACRLRAP